MKRIFKFLILTLFLFVVASCGLEKYESTTISQETQVSTNTKSETTSSSVSTKSSSSTSITSETTSTSTKSSTTSSKTSVTSEISTVTSTTISTSEVLYSSYFNSSSGFLNSYTTGNFGLNYTVGVGYYRTYSSDSSILTCLLKNPCCDQYVSDSAIYNLTGIKGIAKIEITYKSASDFYILSSLDKSYKNKNTISSSSSYKTTTIRVEKAAYFMVCAHDSNVYIQDIVIYYDNYTQPDSSTLSYEGTRINTYDLYSSYTSFSEGETRTIPNSITINGDNYEENSVSVYTYHTLDYASSHTNELDSIALTDPVDVANYYLLFHTWPANYGLSSKGAKAAKNVFGSLARQVSKYSRTNGYAVSVPFKYHGGSTTESLYYELDIDLDGTYSISSRGVGRLVIFDDGFDSSSYDSNPVVLYTTDHYYTFREYNNYGAFNQAFDAEGKMTGYAWTNITTLNRWIS